MKVTKPEMRTALWYLGLTANERNQRYMVVADMDASENESALYTLWYRRSVIGYITMAAKECHF
jgi:hypothetical protein